MPKKKSNTNVHDTVITDPETGKQERIPVVNLPENVNASNYHIHLAARKDISEAEKNRIKEMVGKPSNFNQDNRQQFEKKKSVLSKK